MRDKIKAAIQGSHKSVINGIDSNIATDKVEELFKDELKDILLKIELSAGSTWDTLRAVYELQERYGIR